MVVMVITASTCFRVIISKIGSKGSAGCSSTGSTSIPTLRAPASTPSMNSFAKGSLRFARAATRRAVGSSSRVSSTTLPMTSAAPPARPVILPPGRARLATRPLATGSPTCPITIGISLVACFAAKAAGVWNTTMISTFDRTSSAAFSTSKACCPRRCEFPAGCCGRRNNSDRAAPHEGPSETVRGRELPRREPRLWEFGCCAARRAATRRSRASNQRDELAPLHSITSSARARSVGGMVRPSALAVLRLMTSSNLVG